MLSENKHKIMCHIKDKDLHMKSRWFFIAKGLGLKSGFALTLVLLILALNLFFYYIESNNLLSSLHGGQNIWQRMIHNLPYDIVITILIFALILNYLVRKFEFSYSHPFVLVFSVIVILSIFFSSLLFISDFNRTLHDSLRESEKTIPYLSDFYLNRCCHEEAHELFEHRE